jgi:hypothetical protein
MKRKSINRGKKCSHCDLFGEIPVTWPEVYLWCEVTTNGRFTIKERNFMAYVNGWAVIDKIKAVKAHYGSVEAYLTQTANDATY